jgi:hypothetical protein
MSGAAAAWLLDIGAGRLAAVGAREQLHLVHQPKVYAVPSAPRHCRHVLLLGEQCIPVLDVLARVCGHAAPQGGLLGIYGYPGDDAQTVALGALWLSAPPRSIRVEDAAASDLPDPATAWAGVAHACFARDGQAVPILDLARLFRAAV